MKITLSKELDSKQDVLVLGLFEEDKHNYKFLSAELSKELDEAIKRKVFERKFGSTHTSNAPPYKKTLVIALGKKKEFTLNCLRRALGKAVKFACCSQYSSLTTNLVSLAHSSKKWKDNDLGRATAEGLLLAEYTFKKYLGKEKKEKLPELHTAALQLESAAPFADGLATGRVIAEATNFVKDLVNEPARVATTEYLEKVARSVASQHKTIRIRVLHAPEMKKLGMGAILGVGQGSATPPSTIILEYHGGKGKWSAIVGKGITFDSGGYNLKPTKYIEDMHTDMAGSAAVLGTIKAMAELKVKKNIVGVMAMAENMVSSRAQHPGDIVTAYNGKTIQVGNTDAEGRLVLADALAYTEDKYKPEVIIDLATLTGACVVALGYYAAGMVGNDEALQTALEQAGNDSYDRVWKLPFYEEYQDWMDGSVSDLNNVETKGKGYEAGSITGGVFLSKFVEKARWAHLDIAGTAYIPEEGDYGQKYATGAGVRVLSYYFLQD